MVAMLIMVVVNSYVCPMDVEKLTIFVNVLQDFRNKQMALVKVSGCSHQYTSPERKSRKYCKHSGYTLNDSVCIIDIHN